MCAPLGLVASGPPLPLSWAAAARSRSLSRCSKTPRGAAPTAAVLVAAPPFSVFTRFLGAVEGSAVLSPPLLAPSPLSPLFSTASFFIASSVAASSNTNEGGFVRRRAPWLAMAAASFAARSGSMPVDSRRCCSCDALRLSSRSLAILQHSTYLNCGNGVPAKNGRYLRIWRLTVLFQWFLMMLSVRPGSSFAISAHLLPNFSRASCRIRSSCAAGRALRCYAATRPLGPGRQMTRVPRLSTALS